MKGKELRRIVVVGSTNTDMVVSGNRLPSPGETVSGGHFLMNPGGKGANQAVAVARLSAQRGACAFIAKVGDDVFGRETAARLKKDSILPRLAVDPREPSGTALILVDAKGQNMISVALGSNGTLSPKDVARHRKDIECASALLLQLETPIETVMWAAKAAHDAGVTVILNPAPARKLPRALYPLVDWLTPNETEAGMLSGVEVVDAVSAEKAVAVLKKRGVGHVLVTMGEKGVYCGDEGRLYPCRKVKAVDCVAAGDTFNGAFAVALAEGRSTADAIAFAQAAAAISVTRRGAQPSIPRRREVMRMCGRSVRAALVKCLRPVLAVAMLLPLALRADRPVLAVNEDNDHYFKLDVSKMDKAHLVSYLDEILSPGAVTDFFMCPCGQRASFDSKTWEPIWAGLCEPNAKGETNDVWCVNAKLLHDRGIDPYAVWIARCRERGVRAWLSMRMNDVHFVNIPKYFRNTTFWRTRRDLRRRPDLDPAKDNAPWDSFAFNYAHREVQDYHFAMFKELVDRYDANGYELDWMRFTRHLTPGREREEAPVLTEFMRRCRAYANEAAARRGHPILISARVPTKYEEARERGLDTETWAREGLVDWLITSNFYDTNDFEIDVAGWKRRIASENPSVRVFPGASDNLRKSDVPGQRPIPMTCADFSRWAEAMRSRGADGLYVFNVPYLPEDVRKFVYSGFGGLCTFATNVQHRAGENVRANVLYSGPISAWKPAAGGKVMRFVPEPSSYAKGGEVVMDVEVAWRNVVKDRPTYPWSGVIATGTAIDPQGRKVHVITTNIGWGTHEKDAWRFKGFVPEGSTNLTLEVGIKVAKGEIDFGDARVYFSPCDPARRIRNFKFNEWHKNPVDIDFVNWYDVPTNEPPRLGERGFAFFRVAEPGFTFDRFPPEAAQLADTFRIRVTPGEVRDFFFGVYAEKESTAVKAAVGPFSTCGFLGLGRRKLDAKATLSRVKNWPMCGDMGVKRTYTIMPDPILPWSAGGESLTAGTTAMAMLQLEVPDCARPGVYAGEVAFSAASGERQTANIEVEVLPFRLVRPNPSDYETIAHVGQYGDRRDKFIEMAKEFKRRGIESLLMTTAYGNGRLKLRKGADGRMEIETFDRLRDAVAAYRAAGMTGTFFLHLSDKLEVAVAKALGIPIKDANGEQTHMIPEFETADFKRHIGEALAAIKAECEGMPLAVLAMDEPNTTNRLPRARYEAERIRESGTKVALYGDMVAYDAVKPDYIISSDEPGKERLASTLDDVVKRPGARLYLYIGSGSYHYAFGSMYAGRFNHGWGDYLVGPVHGHTAWNFLAERPTDFSGFRHFSGWATLDHFDADMNLRWTLGYEAICEGFLDRCYINTLETRLAERRGTPAAERVAAKFAALKAECAARGRYRDLVRQPSPKPVLTNGDMDSLRSRIADLIMELK